MHVRQSIWLGRDNIIIHPIGDDDDDYWESEQPQQLDCGGACWASFTGAPLELDHQEDSYSLQEDSE